MSPQHPATALRSTVGPPPASGEPPFDATADRRHAHRIPLLPGEGRILLSHAIRSPLRDISATGVSIVVRPGVVRSDWSGSALLELADLCFPVEVSLVRTARQGAAQLLGAQLSGLAPAAERALSRFMFAKVQAQTCAASPDGLLGARPNVRSVDHELIARIIRQHAAGEGSLAWIHHQGQRWPVQLDLRSGGATGGEEAIVGALREPLSELKAGESYIFVVSGRRALYVFTTSIVERSGAQIVAAFPREVVQTGFRRSARFPCDHLGHAHLHLSDHSGGEVALAAEVREVSASGLSLLVDSSGPVLFPGDRIDRLIVQTPTESIQARAAVRSLRLADGGGKMICGVELLDHPSRQDEQQWQRFVQRSGHPRSRPADQAKAMWDILVDSRYIELWTPPAEGKRLRRQFTRAWTAPDPAVSQAMLLEDARGPLGTLAGSLAYPHTWMLHHMGITEGARQDRSWLDLARELYSGVMYGLEHLTDLQNFVIYLEDGKRWNDFVYGRFAAGYDDPDNLHYDKMLVFRGCTAHASDSVGTAAVLPPNWSIQPASPRLWTVLSSRLMATRSRLEIDALALDHPRIALGGFTRECKLRGYERRRQAFFACERGEPRAAILADSGSEGVNVFGLMNTCWISDLGRGPLPPGLKTALLQRAGAWYRSRGKRTYLFFQPTLADSEDRDRLKAVGVDFVSGGVRWLSDRQAMAAWAASVEDLLRPPHN